MGDHDELQRRLRRAYLGEVGGAAFFAAYAEACDDVDERRKAELLTRLESLTRSRVDALLEAPVSLNDEAAVRATSHRDGAAAVSMGWLAVVRTTLEVVPGALDGYEKIRSLPGGRGIGGILVEHEQALAEFCRAELERRPDAAVPVERLLAAP